MTSKKLDVSEEMAFLLQRYGIAGRCYEDSRVTDMIDNGAAIDGSSVFLNELLRSIHDDWCHDNPDGDGTASIGMFIVILHSTLLIITSRPVRRI